ncbi:hypothetical protein MHH70_01815 [Metasolibacillus sp. FSL H7-0170]|uniref:hypothetical protein n=1 Tax=Metasolibacillus sp. FSL H7-0170 TaxID=2921431 RepID=UPI003157FB1A
MNIKVDETFIGRVTSKQNLILTLDALLFFKLKWTFFEQRRFLKKNYIFIISGNTAKAFSDSYFTKARVANDAEFLSLKQYYE